MKKIIIAFAAGQGLQLLVNYLSHDMVYPNQQVGFCAGAGTIVLVAMIVGAWPTIWSRNTQRPRHTYVEHAQIPEVVEAKVNQLFGKKRPAEDMDEVAPIPEEVAITNTAVIKEGGTA